MKSAALRLPLVALSIAAATAPLVVGAEEKPAAPPAEAPRKAAPKQGAEPTVEEQAADYIRFRRDDSSARLEIAVRTFALPDGTTVDLAGVVHIADAAYYQDLNRRFKGYDAVLFELVGDPEALREASRRRVEGKTEPEGRPHPLRFIQQTAGRMLKLSFQMDEIDYTLDNMVHADASPEEFEAMQKARGESMATLFAKAMAAQYSEDFAEERAALDTGRLLRILLSPDAASEFKIVLAKMFDQAERTSAKLLEGEDGSAILSDRNAVAFRKLKEVAAARPGTKLCVFYGAAHMPGLQEMLIKELKAVEKETEWLAAWRMEKPARRTPKARQTAPQAE